MGSRIRAKQVMAILTILMVLAFVGIGVVRIIQVNQKYPNPEVQEYMMGETMVEDGLSLTVTDCELIPDTRTREMFPSYFLRPLGNPKKDPKVILVTMVLKNEGNTPESKDLLPTYAQSASWFNGMPLDMFEDVNPGINSEPTLGIGESLTVKLPYIINYIQFNDDRAWDAVDRRSFDLVLRTYPDKVVFHLDSIKR